MPWSSMLSPRRLRNPQILKSKLSEIIDMMSFGSAINSTATDNIFKWI